MQTIFPARSSTELHRHAVSEPLASVASLLQGVLSRRLTAYIVGVNDGKTIARWASGEVTVVRDFEIEKRLRATFEITQLLLGYEAPATVKAWFIGLNPDLDDVSPAEALHAGQLREVLKAARMFAAA